MPAPAASGDGGFVEFSAKNNVSLAGGQMIAESPQGAAGTVLIDPTNLTGSRLSMSLAPAIMWADRTSDSITLNNVVIATRNVASGDQNRTTSKLRRHTAIRAASPSPRPAITLGSGTKLLAHATTARTGATSR